LTFVSVTSINFSDSFGVIPYLKSHDDPKLTEPGLPAEILRLQERGIRVVGLTSRSLKKSQATLDQLKLAGIQIEVIHAPDIKSDDVIVGMNGENIGCVVNALEAL